MSRFKKEKKEYKNVCLPEFSKVKEFNLKCTGK